MTSDFLEPYREVCSWSCKLCSLLCTQRKMSAPVIKPTRLELVLGHKGDISSGKQSQNYGANVAQFHRDPSRRYLLNAFILMGAYTRVMSKEHTSPLWAHRYSWKSQAWREGILPGSLSSVQWWHGLCWWYGGHTSVDFLMWSLGQYPLYSVWEPVCKKNPVGKICPQQPEASCLVPIAPTLRRFHLVFL